MADVEAHSIKVAYYTWIDATLSPVLECFCGVVCDGYNWEEAGKIFDDHLKEVKEE